MSSPFHNTRAWQNFDIHSTFKHLVWSVSIVVLLGIFVHSSLGEEDLSQASTSSLQKEADRRVGAKAFKEALPFLEELTKRFSSTDNPDSKRYLDGVLFYLGVAYM